MAEKVCCTLPPSTDNSGNYNIYTSIKLNKYKYKRTSEKTDLHHCNTFIHPGQDRIHLIVPVCVCVQLKYTPNYQLFALVTNPSGKRHIIPQGRLYITVKGL